MKKDILVSETEMQRQREYISKLKAEIVSLGLSAYVETYGCQQNENDSERIRGILSEIGFGRAERYEDADLILFNTCAVRENAELKVYGKLGALKHIKRRKPSLKICLCGCMTQQEHISDGIKKRYPHVDLIFGTHSIYKIPELLYGIYKGERVFDYAPSDGRIAEGIPGIREFSYKAGVSVMYGCNNFCTYCIVPYVRGRERSRKPEEIISEIKRLAEDGVTEIMLLGQNVNSYGLDLEGDTDFADIMAMAASVPGIKRIRFMTSHPKDITEKLIKTIAKYDNICNQLHLPVQSGSNRVLKAMNRRYTREHYLGLIDMARSIIPDIVLTSDIIVGFPGETNEEFEETLSLIEEVRYDMLFTFIYSKRAGTPAADMDDVLTPEEKQRNFEKLLDAQNRISKEINDSYVGKTFEVMCEGVSKTDEGILSGRTSGGKLVHFRGDLCEGEYVKVKITEAKTWTLSGEIV